MQTKTKTYKHGHATMEKLHPSGMYYVAVWNGSGKVDAVRCDDRKTASEYFKAFCKIAKSA